MKAKVKRRAHTFFHQQKQEQSMANPDWKLTINPQKEQFTPSMPRHVSEQGKRIARARREIEYQRELSQIERDANLDYLFD